MKLFIGLLILMGMQQTFAQNRTDPVLFMGNISNPFGISASGKQITTFSFEIKGFNDVSSGEAGAQVLVLALITTTAVSNPCNNSDNMCVQECVEYSFGVYQCFCSKGYEDSTTEAVAPSPLPQNGFVCEDVDECTLYPEPCGTGQQSCNNTIGSYNCTCISGYVVSADQESCVDFDECTNATSSDCDINASCINFDGGFRCECNRGYDGDGTNGNCTDIDECLAGNVTCGGLGVCSNTDGSYRCECIFGFEETNSTGTPTCIDIDECTDAGVSCGHPDAECQNTHGSFRCRCKKGFSGNGTHCTDIDECLGLNDCHVNATCANTHGNYTCECHEDFLGNGFTCNAGEMSYCFRARIVGRIELIRGGFLESTTEGIIRNSFGRLMVQYQRNINNFFVSGYNVTLEPTRRTILIVRICFNAISKTPDELGEIFADNSATGTLNRQFWSLRDYDECTENYLNCNDAATCENTMGDAICTCPDNRYDFGEMQGLMSGVTCMEPIEFECQGSSANISLLTPYWAQKYINVRNVFVNQGCTGFTVGDIWHRYLCNGTVTANGTHLISAFKVADVIPPGGYAINRLDTTFRCIQPAQQNFTTNITSEDNVVDPGVQTDDNAESSIKPLLFVGGYKNAVVDGVRTGEKACVKLEDPNIPENIKIMVEELHTSAPGDDQKFTLLKDYCPVTLPGLEIETTNGGICFTMHRPQASTILEVQLVVNLCTIEDCPTPSCGRKRRSALMRQKRSEELKAISFLIKIDPEDTCDRDCGSGACLLDILNQKQCICPDHSIKTGDGKCKATRNGAFSNSDGSTSDMNILVLVVGLLAGAFLICLLGFVVYSRRRSSILVNDKQMEMKGVYTNSIDVD